MLTECGILGPNPNNEQIERDFRIRNITFHLGTIAYKNDPPFVIYLRSIRFIVPHGGFLVSQDVPDGLHDGTMLDGARCT